MPTCAPATQTIPPAAHHVDDAGGSGRVRRRVRRVVLAVAAPLLLLGVAACEPDPSQESVRWHVNHDREQHGRHHLRDDLIVRLKAQAWADHLAANRTLAHSDVTAGLDALPWTTAAENVGRGASVAAIEDAYMASPDHRSNILDGRWDAMGAGHAVASDGQVYTVQVFVDLG